MPIIRRNDGEVIAWGGEVDGPVQERNSLGTLIDSFSFATKLGVGASEVHDMIVHTAGPVLAELGSAVTPQRDELARRCVALYVEEHCKNRGVPGKEDHFSLNQEEMRRLRLAVLQQPPPQTLLCTVELPLADRSGHDRKIRFGLS